MADGTDDKSEFGANAILGVSLAVARAAADALDLPLYRYVGGPNAHVLPVPMLNVLNGGAHADNNMDVQEFMLLPVGAASFSEGAALGGRDLPPPQGAAARARAVDGASATRAGSPRTSGRTRRPCRSSSRRSSGPGVCPATRSPSGSTWPRPSSSTPTRAPTSWPARGGRSPPTRWSAGSPSCATATRSSSIEDGCSEEDWDGWAKLTEVLGGRVQLVGDDLFVTNVDRLGRGIDAGVANSILVKVNQIGTLTETLDAVALANRSSYTAVMSHRSGETEDTTIADLAVATNCGQIKTGAPARSDRVAKYNQLLRIEAELGEAAEYLGAAALAPRRRARMTEPETRGNP